MNPLTVLRCSVLGDRAPLRVALELVPYAEIQGFDTIEIWRKNHPCGLYRLSTLQRFMQPRESEADLKAMLDSYKTTPHIRGRQCRGRQLDAVLDSLINEPSPAPVQETTEAHPRKTKPDKSPNFALSCII